MKHLGDITKISGYKVPIVDCVIGGSPCQDLSIAGKRAGLAGERSGLYIEQIRLIKEMREQDVRRNNGRADRPVRPRYMVWENVPGAFSSNKGKDFAAVLEEAIRIAEPEAPDVPVPPKGWSNAGAIVGDGWSVAWRTHDAQYWGVPQRRKRISLVADFGGRTAPEILFECKSVSRNLEPSGKERKRPSKGTEGSVDATGECDRDLGVDTVYCLQGNCIDRADTAGCNGKERKRPSEGTERSTSYAVRIRGGCDGGGKGALVQEEKSGTLGTGNDQTVFCIQGTERSVRNSSGFDGNMGAKAGNIGYAQEQYPTLNAGKIINVISFEPGIMSRDGGHCYENICGTLRANMGDNQSTVMCLNDQGGSVMGVSEDVAGALRAQEHGHQPNVYCLQDNGIDRADTAGCNGKGWREDQSYTLNTIDRPAVYDARGNGDGKTVCTITGDHENRVTDYTALCIGNGQADQLGLHEKVGALNCMHDQQAVISKQSVRRLTPLECERLQGFTDGWTDIGEWIDSKGKKHECSDSARYKALGNSIALPFWRFLCKRISAQYARKATMASLFDGIGGFPLVWEEANGKGSAIWASEIDPFCVAVTKRRFGDE